MGHFELAPYYFETIPMLFKSQGVDAYVGHKMLVLIVPKVAVRCLEDQIGFIAELEQSRPKEQQSAL